MGLGWGLRLGLVAGLGLVAAQEALADDEGVSFVADALKGKESDEQGGGGEQTGDETGEGVTAGAEEGADDGHQQSGAAGGATGAENGETGGETGGLEVVGVGSGLGYGMAAFVPDEGDETD